MKRVTWIALVLFSFANAAAAKTSFTRTDAMGAHVNSGRGCPACHTPHSLACKKRNSDIRSANSARNMLWGDDVTGTYAAVGGDAFQKVPVDTSDSREILTCLSCHDGNYGPRAMMRNTIYEVLPSTYGISEAIPTLLDQESLITGHELADHPLGLEAQVRCGGALGWDCTETNGVINMVGIHSSRFAADYGFFVKPSHHGNTSVLACTTCHNPHLMTTTRVTASTASNLFPPGDYPTRHFLRAPYFPENSPGQNSNRSAQFCRQCHADKSNEMNGGSAVTHI